MSTHPTILFSPPSIVPSFSVSILALLARYVAAQAHVIQLRCNGVLFACDRDEESNFQRGFEQCLNCMQGHKAVSDFSASSLFELGTYIPSVDIDRTKKWLSSVSAVELPDAEFDGCIPFTWCTALFSARFGIRDYDSMNRQHESFIRKHMLSVVRARLGARRFLFAHKPSTVFAADGGVQSEAIIEATKNIGLPLIICKPDLTRRVVVLHDWHKNISMQSDLLLKDHSVVPPDVSKWPSELKDRLDEIAAFASIPAVRNNPALQRKAMHG